MRSPAPNTKSSSIKSRRHSTPLRAGDFNAWRAHRIRPRRCQLRRAGKAEHRCTAHNLSLGGTEAIRAHPRPNAGGVAVGYLLEEARGDPVAIKAAETIALRRAGRWAIKGPASSNLGRTCGAREAGASEVRSWHRTNVARGQSRNVHSLGDNATLASPRGFHPALGSPFV
jgi:hypothetical protein